MSNIIQQAWRDVWAQKDRRPIYDWARDNVSLSAPLTKTGAFDVSTSRHFVAIFDALQNDFVREVNCLKPVRGGGTLIGDIWMPWTRTNEPGPFMFVLQTDPIADDHFQKVLMPTLESVPEIRRQLDALDRFKKTGRKIEFSDGNHLHVNGPSIGNLQTNAFRYLQLDECWMYAAGRMADAEARVGDFVKQQRSKIFRVSQGGPAEGVNIEEDDWRRAYLAGRIHEWQVPCLHCGKMMDAAFSGQRADGSFWGMTWDNIKTSAGEWDVTMAADTARFECEHCREVMRDTPQTKHLWNENGAYRVAHGNSVSKQSFHWEAVIDYPWRELVELWLEACNAEHRGDLKPKLQFYQKRRAMFKTEEQLLRGGLSFKRTVYEISDGLQPGEFDFATFDKQAEDLYWGSVRRWYPNGKSRRVWFGKIYGESAIKDIATKYKVQPNRVGIDSGFEPKGDRGVYAMCVRNGWIALKGDEDYEFIHTTKNGRKVRRSVAALTWADPEMGKTGQGRKYAPLIRFSKPQMNQKVQSLIETGVWEEPQTGDPETEREYAEQMGSRIRVVDYNKKSGQARVFWKESKNDHARDLANMQCTFAILADILPDPAAEQLTKSEQITTETT